MAKFRMSAGSRLDMSKVPVVEVAITAATKGTTTQLTAANTLAVGDLVRFTGTGWSSLDGKVGKVSAASATTFTVDIDTSAETATFDAAKGKFVSLASANLIEACVATLSIEAGSADTIATGTFCDPSAALAGNATAGTVSISGFVDYEDAGFSALLAAAADGVPRDFVLTFPKSANPSATGNIGGRLVFSGMVGALSQSYDINAASGFTASITLTGAPAFIKA